MKSQNSRKLVSNRSELGALMDYGALIGLIMVVVVTAIPVVGYKMNTKLRNVSNAIEAAGSTGGPTGCGGGMQPPCPPTGP